MKVLLHATNVRLAKSNRPRNGYSVKWWGGGVSRSRARSSTPLSFGSQNHHTPKMDAKDAKADNSASDDDDDDDELDAAVRHAAGRMATAETMS